MARKYLFCPKQRIERCGTRLHRCLASGYDLLGVAKTASQDEIKKAYRKLAHTHHPDKQGGDEARFKEINEAYGVLGDAEKRRQYDQFGQAFNGGGFGGGGQQGFGGFDFSQFGGQGFDFGGTNFEDLFTDILPVAEGVLVGKPGGVMFR